MSSIPLVSCSFYSYSFLFLFLFFFFFFFFFISYSLSNFNSSFYYYSSYYGTTLGSYYGTIGLDCGTITQSGMVVVLLLFISFIQSIFRLSFTLLISSSLGFLSRVSIPLRSISLLSLLVFLRFLSIFLFFLLFYR